MVHMVIPISDDVILNIEHFNRWFVEQIPRNLLLTLPKNTICCGNWVDAPLCSMEKMYISSEVISRWSAQVMCLLTLLLPSHSIYAPCPLCQKWPTLSHSQIQFILNAKSTLYEGTTCPSSGFLMNWNNQFNQSINISVSHYVSNNLWRFC